MFTSPKHFKDPLSFIPERWTGDVRYASDNKSALQPFSFGPRNCIGKKYVIFISLLNYANNMLSMAYHETRLLLAKVLYNFDLELAPGNENWINQPVYTLWEKKPLLLKLKPAKRVST